MDVLTARNLIASEGLIDFETGYDILRLCNRLVKELSSERTGTDLLIRLHARRQTLDDSLNGFLDDLLEVAGLYPYLGSESLHGAQLLRYVYHASPNLPGVFLHSEQMDALIHLMHDQRVVLSAPTSFGKSLLIDELVACGRYNNIVILQPTLALIDETRRKLARYTWYDLILSSRQGITLSRNIFILTPERFLEFTDIPSIDFFVVDEFYKLDLSRNGNIVDSRAVALNLAVYKLLNVCPSFFFLGPSIGKIPEQMVTRYAPTWIKTNFSTVSVDKHRVCGREEELFRLLSTMDGPTLIYCSSTEKAEKLAVGFSNHRTPNKGLGDQLEYTIQWIDDNVHPQWLVKQALKGRIGVHHGSLPRHLAASMVDLFNEGALSYLFCTSTLMEGVNTAAKNVVLFDKKKGPKPMDFFDFRNLSGRAGRMSRHFIGAVYFFHDEPPASELDVDFPFLTQKDAPVDILIHLKPDDLTDVGNEMIKPFHQLPREIQDLCRANTGVPLQNQLAFLKLLEEQWEKSYPFTSWNGRPTYQALVHTLGLLFTSLSELKPGKKYLTIGSLTVMALNYSQNRSLRELIRQQIDGPLARSEPRDVRIQVLIGLSLWAKRNWFDFKLPKLLLVASSLQAYLADKKGVAAGDYRHFASSLEWQRSSGTLGILVECGVPETAVSKLSPLVGKQQTWHEILAMLRAMELTDYSGVGLSAYERDKLHKLLVPGE